MTHWLFADSINHSADTWLLAMRAAMLQGCLALAFVAAFWALVRKQVSHAFAHGLFMVVPVKTAAAALFVAWPVTIAFSLPLPRQAFELVHPAEKLSIEAKPPLASHLISLGKAQEANPEQTTVVAEASPLTPLQDSPFAYEHLNQPVEAKTTLDPVKPATLISTRACLMFAWLCGCLLLCSILLMNHLLMWRRLHFAGKASDPASQETVNRLARQIGLKYQPLLIETPALATPAVIGLFRPRLLVPQGFFSDFSSDEVCWALLHELAHLRRRDLWSLAFERTVGLALYFHPALWAARRATRFFRELACDDLAQVESGLSPKHCALSFLKLVEHASRVSGYQPTLSPELTLANRYTTVQRRILNMTTNNPEPRTPRLSRLAASLIAAIAILSALPLSPRLVAQAPNPPENQAIASKPAENAKDAFLTFSGKVVDDKNKPIAGAEVTFYYLRQNVVPEPKHLPPVKTDAQGRWTLNNVPSDYERLGGLVTHAGYVLSNIGYIQDPRDKRIKSMTTGELVTQMKPGAFVKGKVLDPDGKPVAGVLVSHTMLYEDLGVEGTKTTTNGTGTFSFHEIDTESDLVLMASKPGFGAATAHVVMPGPVPDEVVIRLEKPRSIKAIVTDQQGKPLAGVKAELSILHNNVFRRTTRSDDAGRIQFTDMPASKIFQVMAQKAGYAEAGELFLPAESGEKQIKLGTGLMLSGTVQNSRTGELLKAYKLEVLPLPPAKRDWTNSVTYEFQSSKFVATVTQAVPPEFQCLISAPGFQSFKSKNFKLADGPIQLDVKLDPIPEHQLPRYRGRVLLPDGTPAANIRIGVTTTIDEPLLENGQIAKTRKDQPIPTTNAQGEFDIRTLEPAKSMLILHESGAKYLSLEKEMDFNRMEIRLEPYARISGTLLRNGQPDKFSRVSLHYKSGLKNQIGQGSEAVIDSAGKFHFDRVVPGEVGIRYQLASVNIHDWDSDWRNVIVKTGESVQIDRDLKRSNQPRRNVVGRLRFPQGQIPPDLSQSMFHLYPTESNPLSYHEGDFVFNTPERNQYLATPEGRKLYEALEEFKLLEKDVTVDGQFRINGLPAGKYKLNVYAGNRSGGWGSGNLEIEIPELKPGEADQAFDIGFVDVINPNIKAVEKKAQNAKPADTKVQSPPPSAPGANTLLEIGGKVVDEKNQPVAGADVQFVAFNEFKPDQTEVLPAVRTDQNGQWRMKSIPARFDQAGVSVTHPKFAQVITGTKFGDKEFQRLLKKETVATMAPGITLRGKIIGMDGKPAAAVSVTDVTIPTIKSPFTTTTTNEQGEFVFENLSPIHYTSLKAFREGKGVATFTVNHYDGKEQTKTVQLEKLASIRITLLDADGKPLPNIQVTQTQIYNDSQRDKKLTDASGMVEFKNLPESKNIRIMAMPPGYIGLIEEFNLKTSSVKTYRLKRGINATGQVRDRVTLKPINDFRIKFQSTVENPQGIKFGQTFDGRNGRFSAPPMNLPLELFDIEITADGYRDFKSKEYRNADGPISLDVILDPIPASEMPRYQGKVVLPNGSPAKNIRIGVYSEKDAPSLENGQIEKTYKNRTIPTTNDNGEFDFQWLEPASELLVVHKTGAKRLKIKPEMEIKNLEIRLEPYSRVIASMTREGKIDPNSTIQLYYRSGMQGYFGQGFEGKKTAEGKYEFEKIIPGLVYLNYETNNLQKNNWPNRWMPVNIPAGETMVIDRELKRPTGPIRIVTGKLKFANPPEALDASNSLMTLLAPEENPLRTSSTEDPAFNSEKRLKYRQTAESRRLFETLEGFPLLEKEISRDGAFRISLPPGKYELSIHVGSRSTMYGNAKAVIDVPELKPGEADQPIDIGQVEVVHPEVRRHDKTSVKLGEKPAPKTVDKVEKQVSVTKAGGLVVDEQGRPITGVRVGIKFTQEDQSSTSSAMMIEAAPTDASGRWSATGLPADVSVVNIVMNHPKYVTPAVHGYFIRQLQDLRQGNLKLQMVKGKILTIKVVDYKNDPVENAAIYHHEFFAADNINKVDVPIGHTSKEGLFIIENATPQNPEYYVGKKGLATAVVRPDFKTDMTSETVKLKYGRKISARLVDWKGKPMPDASVWLSAYRDTTTLPNARTKTGPDGRFELNDLPMEPIVLLLSSRGLSVEKAVKPHVQEMGDLEFGPLKLLKLKATDAETGKPVTKATVMILEKADKPNGRFSRLAYEENVNGEFEKVLPETRQNAIVALVITPDYEPFVTEPIPIEFGKTVTQMSVALKKPMNLKTFSGRAILPDGRPAAACIVRHAIQSVKIGELDFSWDFHHSNEILTNADGRFEFQSNKPVKELLIVGQDHFFHESNLTDWNGELREFKMQPQALIKGKVTLAGKPVSGVDLYLNQATAGINIPLWNGLQRGASTDGNGEFSLPSIYTGEVYLNASWGNYTDSTYRSFLLKQGETTVENIELKSRNE